MRSRVEAGRTVPRQGAGLRKLPLFFHPPIFLGYRFGLPRALMAARLAWEFSMIRKGGRRGTEFDRASNPAGIRRHEASRRKPVGNSGDQRLPSVVGVWSGALQHVGRHWFRRPGGRIGHDAHQQPRAGGHCSSPEILALGRPCCSSPLPVILAAPCVGPSSK